MIGNEMGTLPLRGMVGSTRLGRRPGRRCLRCVSPSSSSRATPRLGSAEFSPFLRTAWRASRALWRSSRPATPGMVRR